MNKLARIVTRIETVVRDIYSVMTVTEEGKLVREENERDALDAVDDHECPPGISVEVVSVIVTVVVVNIKTLTM